MQLPSNESSSDTPLPSWAIQHQSLLEEYDALLEKMRDTPRTLSALTQTIIQPRPSSPLNLDAKEGIHALQALIKDEGYQALCKRMNASSSSLMVTIIDNEAIYQANQPTGLELVTLTLSSEPKWKSHTSRIETAARKLGGQLRADGNFSLARMALYYGMTPWDCVDGTEHQAAIHALEEKRARHSLQLDSGVDIDSLTRAPTADDRKTLESIRGLMPKKTMTMDSLLVQETGNTIKEVIRQFLPATETSLIGYLAKPIASETTAAQIRERPTVFLEKVLRSAEADRLAQALLKGLDWYGAQSGETTSPFVRNKLLSRAIRFWEQREKNDPKDIAGYPWYQRSNYGKSYQAVWSEFENHLLSSERASSQAEAILLASLYRSEFPSAFHRSDIPSDLPYRSSAVWVNFVHGLNLAEVIEPERVAHMTFQQLVDFALQESKGATAQELELIAWCRIPPAVDWAIANGIVLEDKYSFYTDEVQGRALEALDRHTEALKTAIAQMDVDIPKRSEIADKEIKNYFGPTALTSDGRKLIRDHGPDTGSRQIPSLKDKSVSLRDVYMWKAHKGKDWIITMPDGKSRSTNYLTIDPSGYVSTSDPRILIHLRSRKLPDVNELFESEYKNYLQSTKIAYRTLLTSLFSSLPHDDRQAIEYGETKIYTLRQSTKNIELAQETPAITMPLRLRKGFILRLDYHHQTSWYECLPRAGIIRKRTDFSPGMLNGRKTTETWRLFGTVKVDVLRGKQVPFDWDAHESGRLPKKDAMCVAIIEQLGEAFTPEPPSGYPPYISSNRAGEVAAFIAKKFFYHDEVKLYATAREQTELERVEEGRHTLPEKIVKFLPFFGNLDDLDSDHPNKKIGAIFGLFTDAVSFLLPLGKFVSGSVKLASTVVRMGFKNTLPKFSSLSREWLIASLQNFNPLDGLPSLAKAAVRGLYAANKFVLLAAIRKIERLAMRTGKYDFVNGLPQVTDPGRYKLLSDTDDLASVKGLDDVPVRKIETNPPHYRLIEPISDKPYGPSLATHSHELTLGRSAYRPLEKTDQHTIVEVAENAKVREVLEVDGRTTLFIDDVAYQLDTDMLRRADKIDMGDRLKALPCRIRRAAGDTCNTSFVTGTPAPVPAVGTFDETKGWALWFGDSIYTPAGARAPMKVASFANHTNLKATMEFRKGIYGRVKVNVPEQGLDDTFQVGAIISESMDGSKQYVFTRLNAGDFYVAELPRAQSLSEALTFKQASTLAQDLKDELLTVYTGSLNANNMARIHGVDAVERAMKTMDEIAIPIGGHVNPPDTFKLLKVDTSPGEAVLFDHSTRMIVTQKPEGATTWSRSKVASDAFRQRTVEIFDTLFVEPTITLNNADNALRIDRAMKKLHNLIPRRQRSYNPRNIAYAEVTTATGNREVYVSVSGAQGTTGELPLFKNNLGTDEVTVGETTFFNIDFNETFVPTALNTTPEGKLLAVPRTIKNIETYTPTLTSAPTSLDSESKLISVIRDKYPDRESIKSISVATTMPPCESCSVVIKEFGYDGGENALNVLWH